MFALLERNQGVFALSLWVFFPGSLNIASSHCSAQPVLRWLLFASGPLLNLKFLSIFLLKVWKFLIIFIFLGSRIAADGDCSHEIKQALAPWKKSYDKLRQHIKKQRYYFANKVKSMSSLVKAMVFLVVVYRYEIWAITEDESRRIDAFELWY